MKNKVKIYITILSAIATFGYAQKGLVKKADKQHSKYEYIDATQTYEHVAQKGYKSVDLFKKLGDSYYFNSDLQKASKWYGELFAMNADAEIEPEYYYRYAQSLKSVGQYDKANEIMVLFNEKSSNDLRGMEYANNRNYLDVIKSNSGRYDIKDAGINSQYSDYGAAFFGKKVVFTTGRDTGNFAQKIHKWSNQYFTNLYSAEMASDDSLKIPEKFSKQVRTKFHESTPYFTKDGKTMYFTRNNYNEGKKGKDANKITLLKIYKATFKDSVWSDVTALPFSSDNYNTAHPCLSPDEKTLYFVSDMEGSVGQSDIYKVKINDDGSFGTPENLGIKINTEGKESFPLVTDENEIYFASNGLPGLGGFDIFVSKINADGTYTKPINIGAPANSPQDDFAYLIDTKTRKGFLSSNRENGKGLDDIYKFLETKRMVYEQKLSGAVTDEDTGEILANATITLLDDKFNKIAETKTDDKGLYTFDVESGKPYYVRAEKDGYNTKETKVVIPNEPGNTDLPIQLKKSTCKVTVGDNLGVCFGIKDIYFDFDKSNITPKAAIELEKILDVMNQYPKMKIDVRSFTDSRGTHKYNEKLSDRRAKSTVSWLINNGISTDRISGKGFGETQLVNKCSDNVKCTEEEHQANRRSEFIITAIE
ncbi:MAG TPA: OmpA family protein [Flavobacterium sp.]|nr:OmpA family protein [Flavobacterium sp.]